MKIQRIARLGAILILTAICVVCGVKAYGHYQRIVAREAVNEQLQEEKKLTTEERAECIVARMDDSQKIGQLMMIGISGLGVDDNASFMMSQFKIGNVILFDRNMQTPEQVSSLNRQIRKTILQNGEVSPFIGVDQEGGTVRRMKEYTIKAPGERELAQEGSSVTKKWAADVGAELKQMGFNINFAPVVDLNASSSRSFGRNPDTVFNYAQQACEGYESKNIWYCLKHFPGIGKAKVDPHVDGDCVMASYDQMKNEDLKPFSELIHSRDNRKMCLMVSNVTFSNLDTKPACLSKKIMTDILRRDMHYTGLILTDDMEMGAISKHYTFADIGVMAISAGADMVLVCHDYDHAKDVYTGMLQKYKQDPDFKVRVDQSVARIVAVKLTYMDGVNSGI